MQYPPNNQPPFQQQPNTYYPSMIPPPPPPRAPLPPPKKPNAWLIISIIVGGLIIIGTLSTINKNASRQADATPTVIATETPTNTPVPTDTPAPTNTPEPQTVYDWHGKGTQKTNEFSMQGTWHVNWYCLGSSYDPAEDANQYLTINLYNADTGKILQTWQNACVTKHYDKTVKYSGNFVIEGIVTKQAIEYHLSVDQ